jgi:replicative DNA helicase
MEHGPRVMGMADYFELFADKDDNEEQRISNIARNQRRISWETGSCELGISQFNNSVMMSSTKIGGAHRTRYSGAIWHAADIFVEVYNPIQMRKAGIDFVLPDGMSEDFAYFIIEKNKDHGLGKKAFEWSPQCTRFRDLSLPLGEVYNIRRGNEIGDNCDF